jgi:hypothetical protein
MASKRRNADLTMLALYYLFSVLKETPRPSKEIYVALSVKGVTDS